MKVTLLHFGFGDYTIQLANHLADYVDLTVIHPQQIYTEYKSVINPHLRIITLDKPRIRDIRNFTTMSELMKIIKEINPDVLHVQETNDFWYDLTLLFYKMPPLVTTIHDIFRHPGDKDLILGAEYTRRIAFYRSQQLIVHSRELQEILINKFHIRPEKTNVLPHGELGNLFLKRNNPENSIPRQREPYTILFFGRIWPYKGLKYLLKSLPLVADKIPKIKLIIAGRGENINEMLQDINPENYELLNGYIPNDKVTELFQKSAAVVLPYIESSQSGVASIAYKLGTPVIASNIGGLGEMIKDGQDGLLVPPRDVNALAKTIIDLLTNTQLQDNIRQSALERCQQDLNWSNIALQTVGVYQKLIS